MDFTKFGKRALLDALSTLPYTGAFAREWDSIETDRRFKAIEQEISQLWEAVGRDSKLPVEESVLKTFHLIETSGLAPNFQFRRAESCMALMGKLSRQSKLGQEADPALGYDECLSIVRSLSGAESATKELEVVVYELQKADLIHRLPSGNAPKGWHAISPKDFFFCRTDRLFQPWDPSLDAMELIVVLISKTDESANLAELDSHFGWGPRRLNSAVAFLHQNDLIHHNYHLGGIEYVLQWVRLTPKALLVKEEFEVS